MATRQITRGRNAQLDRVLKIIRDLSRLEGSDVYELAERYGAAVKTIRRDLEALQQAGIPLERETADDTQKTRWRFNPKADTIGGVTKALDAQHFLALRLAMSEAGAVDRTSGLFATLEDLAQRIEKAVGPKGRAQLAAIDRCFTSWDKHAYRRAPREHLVPLVDAIDRKRICRVSYLSASSGGKAKEYDVLPMRLFVHDRAVYLLCSFGGGRGVGMLNLHRLEKLAVTDRTGEPPPGFDFETWSASAFSLFPGGERTRYVLRFRPEVAQFIRERVWHPSQVLRELKSGGVELRFTCGESHEVTSWVASWREWVEVVGPATLREDLRRIGSWLTVRYRPSRARDSKRK